MPVLTAVMPGNTVDAAKETVAAIKVCRIVMISPNQCLTWMMKRV